MEDRLLAALHRLVRFPFRSIGRAPDMIGTGGPFIGMAVCKRDTAQLVSAGQQDNVMHGWEVLAEDWAKVTGSVSDVPLKTDPISTVSALCIWFCSSFDPFCVCVPAYSAR